MTAPHVFVAPLDLEALVPTPVDGPAAALGARCIRITEGLDEQAVRLLADFDGYALGELRQVWFAFAFATGVRGRSGVVVLDDWNGSDVRLQAWGRGVWSSRRVLRFVADYAFNTLGCARMSARVRASDRHVRGLLARLNFQHEGTLRRAAGDEDVLLFGLLRAECKWLSGS